MDHYRDVYVAVLQALIAGESEASIDDAVNAAHDAYEEALDQVSDRRLMRPKIV